LGFWDFGRFDPVLDEIQPFGPHFDLRFKGQSRSVPF
jgi:hypothetical protein